MKHRPPDNHHGTLASGTSLASSSRPGNSSTCCAFTSWRTSSPRPRDGASFHSFTRRTNDSSPAGAGPVFGRDACDPSARRMVPIDTKHAKYISRSEEPGLVTASSPKGMDIHVGSNLCRVGFICSPGGNVVIVHHNFILAELRASAGSGNDSDSPVVPRVSLIPYMDDASQEFVGSRMRGESKKRFQLRLHCSLSGVRG